MGVVADIMTHLEGLSNLLRDPGVHLLMQSLQGKTGLSVGRIAGALARGREHRLGNQISEADMLDAASKAANVMKEDNPKKVDKPKMPTDTPANKKIEGDKTGKPNKDTPEKPEEDTPEKVSPGSSTDKPPTGDVDAEAVVNSSTHRNEHARLSRRMASLPEAEFPNMHRLWSGSRQDSVCTLLYGALTSTSMHSLLKSVIPPLLATNYHV